LRPFPKWEWNQESQKRPQLEEKTNFERLFARQVSSNVSVAQVLFSKYFAGLSMDSATSAKAAKCMTASKRLAKKSLERQVAIASIAYNQRNAIRQRTAATAGKIIHHGDLVIVLQQKTNGRAADITCAPRHKHMFRHLLYRAKRVLLKGRYDVRRTERSNDQSKHNERVTNAGIQGRKDGKRMPFWAE